ncbi:MAG TPA: hypothetical protein V6D46_03215, partial [Coleofasciculaceae cyanobacterium]
MVATLSDISPALAQTSCRWDNGQLRCDDNNSDRNDRYDDDRDRDDRYNNDRYNSDRYNNDRYNSDRYNNDRYDNRGDRQDIDERIDRLYREVLGRPADSSGLRTYRDRVRN